jgi:hypothetical protein
LRKPIFAFCADLQARESAYKAVKELGGDDLFALRQVVDKCIELDIPLILGGDQVDTPSISDEHTVALRKELARMKRPVWFIDGNHERGFKRLSLEGGSAAVAINLENVPVEVSGLKIRGFNWRPRRQWDEYLISNSLEPADIVILHGFAEQVIPALGLPKDEKPICDLDLDWFDGKYKLALMGDIHMEWDYRGPKGTRFIYSGSMWMHRVGEVEAKSFVLVFEDLTIERIPLKCRPFLQTSIESEKDYIRIEKWIDNAYSLAYISELMSFMGSKIPRIHVTVPSNPEPKISAMISQIENRAFVFKKVNHSHDRDLDEIKGSMEEKIDIDTALAKLLDASIEAEQEAITFIKQAMDSGFDKAIQSLKNKIGI